MKLFYISEFSLPSNRAYSIHVFKMLDAFAKKKLIALYLSLTQKKILIKVS